MQLAFAMLADFAEATPDGKVTIGGGDFDSIYAPAFPAVHARTIALVVRFSADPTESATPHILRAAFRDPQDKPWFSSVETPFPAPRSRSAAETPAKFAFVFNFTSLVFPMPGRYVIQLFLDQDAEPVASVPIYAIVQTVPPSNPHATAEETAS